MVCGKTLSCYINRYTDIPRKGKQKAKSSLFKNATSRLMQPLYARRIQDPSQRIQRSYRGFLAHQRHGAGANGHRESFRDYVEALTSDGQGALSKWHCGKKEYTTSAPYQVLDLFCGSGGMSAGFSALGDLLPSFEVVGGCDIDPDAASSFERTYGTHCLIQDLSEIVPDRRSARALLKSFTAL